MTTLTAPAGSTGTRTSPPGKRRSVGPTLAPYAFIAPFYLLYVLFMIVPILAAMVLSTTQWAGLGSPTFVGLRNYAGLLTDTSFWTAMGNSGIYVLVSVLVVVPLSLLVAQALNAKGLRGRDLFRVTYFIPMVISPIVISLIFSMMLDTEFGLVNTLLQSVLGFGGVDWLGDPTWAKVSLSFVMLWRWVGYLTIFFLAGLQAVPRELYEAAELDGAGTVRKFTTVTLPAIQPVTAFVVVTSFISAAQIFDEPYLLTRGGPGESTLSIAMFVFRAAFERQQFGYAAAAGIVLFVVVFAVSRLLNRALSIGKAS
ncbi:permease component of ABC-type sugar transporter [Sanguibacter keddieii DSM 10542]|uniref:Permease component of ABC-type sugar transporter n=1 Tax=Sanguibacter keddieii (strain ATCC 51767 / DSM 10542 / NCFB 3025 / ST-74) TaxID=446469 RepID=D1BDP2_SANKS|nr:sugar ABC transporter permease [Sanguibacter keddieii]ACZ21104.1 permease component of ABC-type sugar transporter [Sanguibacter keddieii DSM 10542]